MSSQHEANKVLRVIEGKQMKLTIRIHRANGKIVEFQSDDRPTVAYDDGTRLKWIYGKAKTAADDYSPTYPICPWEEGDMILCEANPGMVKP